MSRAGYERFFFAAILLPVLTRALRADPVRPPHPRNLYETHVDLSEDEARSIQIHLEHVAGLLL